MYKGNELLGKPIIAAATGEIVEKVADLVVDNAGQKVLALLADEGGLFAAAKIVPFDAIRSVGPDAIMVESPEVLVAASEEPAVEAVLEQYQKLVGLKVVTESGEDLGTIKDLYLNDQTGTIEGYEVSGGLAKDMKDGRAFLPAPKTLTIGKDVVIVPDEAAQLLNEQVGGWRGAVQQAGAQVKKQTDRLTGRAQTAAERVKGEVGADTDIYTQRTREFVDTSKDELRQGWQEVQETAGAMWGKVKEQSGALRDQTSAELEERRIKAALGHVTDRVVLDHEDNVVLERGEIITHKAIEQARQAGVLDILLGSVASDKKVGV